MQANEPKAIPDQYVDPAETSFSAAMPIGGVAMDGIEVEVSEANVAGETSNEVQSQVARIEAYLNRMRREGVNKAPAEESSLQTRDGKVFSDFATSHFKPELISLDLYSSQEYNPILLEFAGMMSSLEHNAGVYYSEDEVPELFGVIADYVLADDEIQRKLQQAEGLGDAADYHNALLGRVEKVFSLDRKKALALVKGINGAWRVADEREYGSDQDFKPLEIIRQDNRDKAGWNKYRFRTPTYTREQDNLYARPIADGWFTSEWKDEPSYWAEQLRTLLVQGTTDAEAQLEGSAVSIALITEGGVLKGTSTAETDMDTTCSILADSVVDFEQAYQICNPAFSDRLAALSFGIKKGERMSFSFYDRSTGGRFFRDAETGEYKTSTFSHLLAGEEVFEIRKNEQGIGISKNGRFSVFAKPDTSNSSGISHVAIDIETGNVRVMADEEVAKYDALEASRQPKIDHDEWEAFV